MRSKNRAIFLDRDGVINHDTSYLYKIDDFKFIDGIFDLLKHLKNLGYIFIIVTNQSGIGRGYYTENDFTQLTKWMIREFKKRDIEIKKVYHCPHKPDDNCECRKPKPKMLLDAIKEFNIETKNSWMIGDKLSDIEAAKNADIPNTILLNDIKSSSSNYVAKSLYDIINIIKS